MADETDTTSEAARVLGAHAYPNRDQARWWCQCGASIGQDWKQRDGLVRAHQAAMLAKAGLLRETVPARSPECSCAACDPGVRLGGDSPIWFASRMNVCPDCGNKRCPKAANHAKWQCSGSNETGQVGVPVEDPQIAASVPAERTQGESGDSRVVGGLGERLRALIPAACTDDGYFGVTALEIGEFADEAHRLEVHARIVEQSLRRARAEGDEARGQVERVRGLAQWFRDQGQTGYARKVEEAVELPCACKRLYEPTCPAHGDGHTPEPQHDHQWITETTYQDTARGYVVQQCTLPGCGVKRDLATGGPITGKSQIVGLPEGGCEVVIDASWEVGGP